MHVNTLKPSIVNELTNPLLAQAQEIGDQVLRHKHALFRNNRSHLREVVPDLAQLGLLALR
jgi:hypothetical protein